MTDTLTNWMTAYRKAWESNDPADIGALFTDDAVYYKEPFTEPLRGRDAIIAMWHEHQDAAGTFTFTWKPFSVTETQAFVQGETGYATVRYSNLWVIRLAPDGRATEFTEWWMDQSKPS
jgi:ketosteroid isomerase-like protein